MASQSSLQPCLSLYIFFLPEWRFSVGREDIVVTHSWSCPRRVGRGCKFHEYLGLAAAPDEDKWQALTLSGGRSAPTIRLSVRTKYRSYRNGKKKGRAKRVGRQAQASTMTRARSLPGALPPGLRDALGEWQELKTASRVSVITWA